MKNSYINFQRKGFSLIEILIVILIFSVLAILATQSLALSLRGSKKSELIGGVRESVDYSVSIMERLLRSAKSVSCSPDNTYIDYRDEFGNAGKFSCLIAGGVGYIASGSANLRLTATNVNIDCAGVVFSCPTPAPSSSPSVSISIKANSTDTSGEEATPLTVTTKILLRNY